MASLLNRTEVKRRMLKRWKELRPYHEMTRVSEDTLNYLEGRLRNVIEAGVSGHPSKGRTIKLP